MHGIIISIKISTCFKLFYTNKFRNTKKPERKDSKRKFAEPLEDQFDTENPVFTIDSGRRKNKRSIPIGGSSYRSPDAPPAEYVIFAFII